MTIHQWIDASVLKAAPGEVDARFIMSAASPDRVRDTINPDSFDQIAAKADRVIALFNHDAGKPIGYWSDLARKGDRLVGAIKFAGTNVAQMVRQLLADGVPLGASIGFRAKATENKHGGYEYSEIDLLECSIVATPAHPRAVQIAKSFGISLDLDLSATSGAYAATRKRAANAIVIAKRTLKNDSR